MAVFSYSEFLHKHKANTKHEGATSKRRLYDYKYVRNHM